VPHASYQHLLTETQGPPPDSEKAKPGRGTRVAPLGRTTINYGWAAPMGLQLVTGFDAYNFRHYQTFMDVLRTGSTAPKGPRVWTDLTDIARADLLEALDVRYIVARKPERGIPSNYLLQAVVPDQPVFLFYEGMERASIHIYARTGNNSTFEMNRAYWVKRVITASTEDAMVGLALENDLRETAVIMGEGTSAQDASSQATVRLMRQYDGHLELDLSNDTGRFLAISEVWHPGWSATLDGQEIRLMRANIALIGAWIPPGTHRMVMDFRPVYWTAALTISLVSAMAVFALACWVSVARVAQKRPKHLRS
jgi:hypothetical protein